MGGQAYVTVQAEGTSTYSAKSVGSNSAQIQIFTIYWTFSGGITNNGWTSPVQVTFVDNNVAATNQAISDAYSSLNSLDKVNAISTLVEWECAE